MLRTGMVTNNGEITGGSVGTGDADDIGVIGGTGVSLSGGTLTNKGTITGGAGGGIGVELSGGTLTNEGTITGGAYDSSGAGSGLGIASSDVTIVNSGMISRGFADANAITFTGGMNRLELRAGSVINGVVDATAGTSNTLTLGGSANSSFNVAQIGPTEQYRGFQAFEKTGASTWTLTGTSSEIMPWTINAGTLAVNGAIASSTVTINNGGMLAGNGTVGGIMANAGGTVSPGNSIGTLTVAGNVTFQPGSVYQVEINPQVQNDLLHATGTATLNGGTVSVIKAGGTYTAGTRYTILTADAGVTGVFSGLTQNLPLIDLMLSYNPNNVFLDVARNAVAFCDLAATRNQCSTAHGAESLGAGSPVFDAIASLPNAASAQAAFDSLSGEIHASAKSVMLEDSRFIREAVTDRVRQAFTAVGAPAAWAAGQALQENRATGIAFWTRGFGSWGHINGDGNAARIDRDIGGFFTGVDMPVAETWRLGLAAGYSNSSFDVIQRSSSGTSDNYHFALYGGTQWGALGLRLGAAYTWHTIDTHRSIAFPGFADRTNADYDARTAQMFGELGYSVMLGAAALEPFGSLAHVNLGTDGVNERGGPAALSGFSGDEDVTYTTLGLHMATSIPFPGITTATARGTLGWRHAFGDVMPTSILAFSGGNPFTIAGVPIARDALVAEAGLDVNFAANMTLGVSYSGQIADDAQEHGVRGNFTWKF
ncbi:MAG: autotransporter outer membrane beta-barrel domain-containing protein [Rhizobiales bacterium]|nr:autotransporter outer membrane beta-barrel domain-containing protein [Hyphomicrobiales bacterium]